VYIRLKMYNWQRQGWPHYTYNTDDLQAILMEIAIDAGRIHGILETLPTDSSVEAQVEQLTLEAITTSEIEGEFFNRIDVASSIRKNLGLTPPRENIRDQRAVGIGELMVKVREQWDQSLSATMLHEWHKALMTGNKYITPGKWRSGTEPMQIISGSIGKEVIHYEAPPSKQVPLAMKAFIQWYNQAGPKGKNSISIAPVRAAITHLYFETIHPYEDGNGRIGRALADKALYETIGYKGLPSISSTIAKDRQAYYEALREAQNSLDITSWVQYFVTTIATSLENTEKLILFTLKKTQLFDRLHGQLNPRQVKILTKMLSEGPTGFEGGMTAKKYMRITKTSKPTATRDLRDLYDKGALVQSGGGRSVSYQVKLND